MSRLGRKALGAKSSGRVLLGAVFGLVAGVACVGDVGLPAIAEDDCSLDARKQFVDVLMRDYYLWYDQIPETVDYDAAETPEALMRAMMYRSVDRWSGMQELVERTQYFGQGRYQGFGYILDIDSEGALRVSWSHEGSPAGQANFVRGDELVAVNGQPLQELTDQELGAALNADVLEHTLVSLQGVERTVELTKGDVNITSVKSTTILDRADGKVGYLMFTNFVDPADAELRTAFATFQEAGVERLVIDLRYNSGGLLRIAALLGSLIRSESADEALIVETYNDRHPDENRRRLLFETQEGVNASQVVFLTGPRTASASEQVINGLRPYLDVQVVGTRTLGKPVGADSWEHCGFAIVPITFQSLNADGEGEFFGGIEPDCVAGDDLLHLLGDPEEAQLKGALALMEGGRCSPVETESKSLQSKPAVRRLALPRRQLPAGPILGVPGTY